MIRLLVLLLCTIAFTLSQNASEIEKVHLVFMTHLDLGFTTTVVKVLNEYFDKHLMNAIDTAAELRKNKTAGAPQFIYTSHPWLINMFIDCPKKLWPGLHCPSDETIKKVTDAVQRGDLTYHAFSANTQAEIIGDVSLAKFGVELSRIADRFFNLPKNATKKTLSQRDVPGITRAMIPILAEKGVIAISIGSNGVNASPEPPGKVFKWIDTQTDTHVLATVHPRGYGGPTIEDCVLVPNFKEALCMLVELDNLGPATTEMVKDYYIQVQSEFPNAKIIASTFDAFFTSLDVEERAGKVILPESTSEMSDVWMYGVPSDPLKMAKYRLLARLRAECVKSGECDESDKRIRRFSTHLIKIPEHTWGINFNYFVKDYANYTNDNFHPIQYVDSRYKLAAESWVEQRNFLDMAIASLENHPLSRRIRNELPSLIAREPKFHELNKINPKDVQKTGRYNIKFDEATGAIELLDDIISGKKWATFKNKIAEIKYTTYDEDDYVKYLRNFMYDPNNRNKDFDHWGLKGQVVHHEFTPKLLNLYRTAESPEFVAEIVFDKLAKEKFGAYQTIYVTFTVRNHNIDIRCDMLNKTSTRIPEALFLSFNPAVDDTSGIIVDKLGSMISPLDIMKNGSVHQHGVTRGVTYLHNHVPQLSIEMIDVPVLAIGEATPFPTPVNEKPDLSRGIHANYYNNIWGTNYIMWYPYTPEDRDGVMRFRLNMHV